MNTENKMIVDTGNSSMAAHTEITYTQVGDYLLPNLTLDPQFSKSKKRKSRETLKKSKKSLF